MSSKRRKKERNGGREEGKREGIGRKEEEKKERGKGKGEGKEENIWPTNLVLSDSTKAFTDYYSIYIICLDLFTSVCILFSTLICSLKCHCIFNVYGNFLFSKLYFILFSYIVGLYTFIISPSNFNVLKNSDADFLSWAFFFPFILPKIMVSSFHNFIFEEENIYNCVFPMRIFSIFPT